jgi:mycothiol S-conjugate amidase
VLNPAMDRPEVWERLPQIRVEEMAGPARSSASSRSSSASSTPACPRATRCRRCRRAASRWCRVEEAAAPLVALIRRFKPQVITTYDERGGYPHPDHIKTHEISVHAFEAAGDPDRYPELGEPWQPSKLYYHMSFTLPRTRRCTRRSSRRPESPYAEWLANWDPAHDISHRVTTRVPCAEYFPVRDAALIAHATQIDPTGRWFACPLEVQQQVWPTEDYELARSLVDTPVPEDDLFAGIRSEVGVR